jgi:hypothetical protein
MPQWIACQPRQKSKATAKSNRLYGGMINVSRRKKKKEKQQMRLICKAVSESSFVLDKSLDFCWIFHSD